MKSPPAENSTIITTTITCNYTLRLCISDVCVCMCARTCASKYITSTHTLLCRYQTLKETGIRSMLYIRVYDTPYPCSQSHLHL